MTEGKEPVPRWRKEDQLLANQTRAEATVKLNEGYRQNVAAIMI